MSKPESGGGTGRSALVTGGVRGIGLGIACRLASEGVSVLVTSRSADEDVVAAALERVSREGRVVHATCDVASETSIESCVDLCLEIFGSLDVVVANAASDVSGTFIDLASEAWNEVIGINLTGVFHTIRLGARRMMGGGGRIVVVSSTNAFYTEVGCVAYNTAKAGLQGLVRSAALELAPHGITVNAVSPGLIPTRMSSEVMDNPRYADVYLRQIPVGRFGSPDDVAGAVSYLASPEASWITGQEIIVDGGRTIGMSPRLLEL